MKLFFEGRPVHGQLTTEHAASSYGQPVLVLDDGRALGPGDILAQDLIELNPKERRWIMSGTTLGEVNARRGHPGRES